MADERRALIARDERGVATVWLDAPGRPLNVLHAAFVRELAAAAAELANDPAVKLVVVRSAKPSGFLAGADVYEIAACATIAELDALGLGHDAFGGIARLAVPTLAALHGPCLGGGLEVALACAFRIARNDPATRLGMPETGIGLIPGWAGTQRLPRLVGAAAGLEMILGGQPVDAAQALALGLVDAVAPPERFDAAVEAFAARLLADPRPRPPREESAAEIESALANAAAGIAARERSHPAFGAAWRAIAAGLRQGFAAGLAEERAGFTVALRTPASRNLLEQFFQRDRARKRETWVAKSVAALPIKTVVVWGDDERARALASYLKAPQAEGDDESRWPAHDLALFGKLLRDATRSKWSYGASLQNACVDVAFAGPLATAPMVEIAMFPNETPDSAVGALTEWVKKLGKAPVVVRANGTTLLERVLAPYLDEALRLRAEGHAEAEIDAAAVGFGMVRGPCAELADAERWASAFAKLGLPAHAASRPAQPAEVPAAEFAGESLDGMQQRLAFALVNAAAGAMHENRVAETWMVDLLATLAGGFPAWRGGPLAFAVALGIPAAVAQLERLAAACGPRFMPSAWLVERAR